MARVDLCFRNGDTSDAWSMNFLDKDNSIIQLDGYEFFMEIRHKDEKLKLNTIGNGLSIVDDYLFIDKREKEDLEPGIYDYALKMKEPDGDLYTFMYGKITIEKELVDEDF